jgi:chemotaxis regulatin CheY-phosphate phosphatase CheZ
MEKASAAARRLSSLLEQIDDLTPEVVQRARRSLDKVVAELDELIPDARDRIYPTAAAS